MQLSFRWHTAHFIPQEICRCVYRGNSEFLILFGLLRLSWCCNKDVYVWTVVSISGICQPLNIKLYPCINAQKHKFLSENILILILDENEPEISDLSAHDDENELTRTFEVYFITLNVEGENSMELFRYCQITEYKIIIIDFMAMHRNGITKDIFDTKDGASKSTNENKNI